MNFRILAVTLAAGAALISSPASSTVITGAQVEYFSYNGGGTGSLLTNADEATYTALTGGSPPTTFQHFTFNYTGDLNWSTTNPANTVGDFITNGTISILSGGLESTLLGTQMSNSGDSKTSFFRITGTLSSPGPFSGTITHDDGLTFILGGNTLINSPGETPSDTNPFSTAAGFGSTSFIIDYVEGNGAPSILNFSVTAVPEPATWAMMILGFLGVGLLGYRRKSAFRFA